jgi:2-polyprenyl-3-methyl-5-hydroxy-6-metoxy-1,4-benzoquinol methylase
MTQYRKTLYQQYFSNQIAANYSSQQWDNRVFSVDILPHLPQNYNAKIIEIGCGHGNLLHYLKEKKFTQILGCDLSSEQVAIAKKNGHEVIQQDAMLMLEKQENIDVLIAVDVLEHCTKDEAVSLLQKAKEKLSPSGKLIFRIPNAEALIGTAYLFGDVTHELFLNSASANQLFLSCGFNNVAILPGFCAAKGWKRWIQLPLQKYFFFVKKLQYLASGTGSKGKIFTPNLVIVAS